MTKFTFCANISEVIIIYQWNDEKIKRHYERVLKDAKRDRYNFTDEELESPYLDKLSHQTKSSRIMRMITLAYHLGKLKGVRKLMKVKHL